MDVSATIITQFVKDLSFENPKAPDSLKIFDSKPEIKIDIDINSKPLKNHGEDIYEVNLMIKGSNSTGLNKISQSLKIGKLNAF